MNPLAGFRIALDALRANKLRSALTMLGIIIGVGAVIVMVAIGAGSRARVAQQLETLGSNLVMVLPGAITTGGARLGSGTRMNLTEDDAAAIRAEIPGVLLAGVTWWAGGQAVYGNQNWSTRLHGVSPDFLAARTWEAARGRLLSWDDVGRAAKVAVLGQTVAEKLFGDADPVGATIRLRTAPFTVIGVLAPKGQTAQGSDYDDIVFVPLPAARAGLTGARPIEAHPPTSAIVGKDRYATVGRTTENDFLMLLRKRPAALNQLTPGAVSAILVKVADAEASTAIEQEMEDLLRQRHRLAPGAPADFSIRNFAEIARVQKMSSATLSAMLAMIAAVSLLVGGIGIMNIMLVSVTERKEEIGLRMAVGARRRDILRQFLIEAMTLSLIGGSCGAAAGVAVSGVAGELLDLEPIVELSVVALSFGFAGAVGVAFGYYPAWKASRLDPIVALRHE